MCLACIFQPQIRLGTLNSRLEQHAVPGSVVNQQKLGVKLVILGKYKVWIRLLGSNLWLYPPSELFASQLY